MKLFIFGKNYEVDSYSAFEIINHFTLVAESLEFEFSINEGAVPYIDLTSTHFSHKQIDVSDFLFQLSSLGERATTWDRLHDIAIECRKVHVGSWRCTFYRLRDPIIKIARLELLRVIELIRTHFPELEKSVG